MRLIGTAVLLAATSTSAGAQPAAFLPAKLYRTMFVEGTKVTLGGTRAENEGEERFRLRTRPAKVRCTVTNVRATADAIVADLGCDKAMQALGGAYGATASGLYRIDQPSSISVETIEMGALAMPARPKVGKTTHGPTAHPLYEEQVTRSGSGFCHRITSVDGDTYSNRYCFAGGRLTAYEADDGSSFPVVIKLARL